MRNPIPAFGNSTALTTLTVLLAILFHATRALAVPAAGDLGNSASLDALVGQPTTLTSQDGTLQLSDFNWVVEPGSSAPPAANEILLELTTAPDSLQTELSVTITGPSQILFSGDDYNFQLSYTAHSLDPQLAFTAVSLDIEAGTLGTTGTGSVRVDGYFATDGVIAQAVLGEALAVESPLVQVFVDGDGGQLLNQITHLPQPALRMDAVIDVVAEGGADRSSGAVLSDFVIGAERIRLVPEPSTLGPAALLVGLLLLHRARGIRAQDR